MAYGALHADGAAVVQNNVLYDCQAKSGATAFARPSFIDAVETLEDGGQMF